MAVISNEKEDHLYLKSGLFVDKDMLESKFGVLSMIVCSWLKYIKFFDKVFPDSGTLYPFFAPF